MKLQWRGDIHAAKFILWKEHSRDEQEMNTRAHRITSEVYVCTYLPNVYFKCTLQ
jgi:hypothetical protein